MPKFICAYKLFEDDIIVGFNHIAEVVSWLKGFGSDRDALNAKVFIDVGEHKYLQIIVYFAE